MTFIKIYICFFIYSIIGWIWESFLCSSVELKKLVNRGFFLGPYCPIYGLGATLSYLLLRDIGSATLIFILASIVSCTIEYIVGYILEKMFKDRWWNYDNYPFQLHGRVCLYGLVIFGLANVVIVKFSTPFLMFSLSVIKDSILIGLAISISLVSFVDLIITISARKKLNKRLSNIHERLEEKADIYFENMTNSSAFSNEYLLERGKILRNKAININEKLKTTEDNIKSYRDEYFS
ncbi:putative ABC transporter permease [Peptoniphilus lacrimalis]|uniref:putative ABC transporter permease n=1 Tax=Peptoniphilus lacrimalis TaxID=33031 RepID=UPI0023F75B23|nr:putative ABC transporter permease [Peptoniphilus lacrimalis]MDK7721823.1 putative ABC transporter permease [Peptoniphilus lacrimalis]MDK7731425.1 putative ABC transporter permease [Peptoniphilus lacrimalis]